MTGDARHLAVKMVGEELGTKLSFGYIGNCGVAFDDRSWAVWFHDFPRGEPFSRYSNVPALWLGSTDQLPSPEELARKVRAHYAHLSGLLEAITERG